MPAKKKKHVNKLSCSSVRVFLGILAHLAQFILIFKRMNISIERANTKKHFSEHNWFRVF